IFERQTVARLCFHSCGSLLEQCFKAAKHVSTELLARSLSHRGDAGANPAAGFGDHLIVGACDPLFEIDQPRRHERRMRMAVNHPGQHASTTAIQLFYFALVFPEPGMLEDLALEAGSHDLAAATQNGRVLNNPDFPERASATRRIFPAQS